MARKIDRRQLITTAGGAALGTIAAANISGSSYAAAGSESAFGAQRLPYNGFRIIELSKTLAGRLAGNFRF